MLRLAGAALLTAGAWALGFGAAAQLRRRAAALRAMEGALELAERELSFRLTPIPELLEGLSQRSRPPASAFFARCLAGLDRLGEQTLGQIWDEALSSCPTDLRQEDRDILSELGQVLGRYDGEGQRKAVAQTERRLAHQLEAAEEERDRLGRVYQALGLTVGGFFAILLA